MKIKAPVPVVKAFATIALYGYSADWQHPLVNLFVRSSLESLILKLSRLYRRITQPKELRTNKLATISLNHAEALVMLWCIDIFKADHPNTYEALMCAQYFEANTPRHIQN